MKHQGTEGLPRSHGPVLPRVAEEEVGGTDMAGECSEAQRQFFLGLWNSGFLGWRVSGHWRQRADLHTHLVGVLEMQPFIIIFLNKAGQWQCKQYLNKSIWLLEIKAKGK